MTLSSISTDPTLPAVERFVAERRARWAELTDLVAASRGRADRLPRRQLLRLGALYRASAADLSRARQRWPGDPVVAELEALVEAARSLVYRSPGGRRSFVAWLTTGTFERIAERPRLLLAAAALLFVPLALGLAWGWADPDAAGRAASVSGVAAGAVDAAERGDPGAGAAGLDPAARAELSTVIFTNNVRVALAAFAGGMTGGVLTTGALLLNGATTGLVVGVFVGRGLGGTALSLFAPHGLLELSLLVVAGAAGLRLGLAVVAPGLRPRAEAVVAEGRAAVEMALGVALWLVPTGLVEGFVSPRALPPVVALAVGLALAGTFWTLVVVRGRRGAAQSRADALASR